MELSSKIISDDEMSSDSSPKSSKELERESLSRTHTIVLWGQVDKRLLCIAHTLTKPSERCIHAERPAASFSLCNAFI